MLKITDRLRLSVALLLVGGISGCQVWHASPHLSGLTATKGERQVVKRSKNDPFPSPSDVGMEASE
ncbi:MAG: hypothetical protein GXP26_05735 [Planctomycetes bacterium]|nr:hypothetical protein [Planctomycetota bacterium]